MGMPGPVSKSSFEQKSYSMFSKWKDAKEVIYTQQNLPNPDPSNYQILALEELGSHVVVKIRYLDCTNYEGVKILLFKNTTAYEILNQKLIDPHFSENKKFLSPFARFEPTSEGWKAAINFTKMI